MTLRLSEEEFAELMRRRGDDLIRPACGGPPSPKGEGNQCDPGRVYHKGDDLIRPACGGPPSPKGEGKQCAPERAYPKGEGKQCAHGARRRKYGNVPVTVDGKRFDSKHEAEVYGELMFRKRAGELRVVLRQVPFDLPGGIKYIADFVTLDFAGNIEVIDAKSPITRQNRVYINKKKQLKSEWGFEVKEV